MMTSSRTIVAFWKWLIVFPLLCGAGATPLPAAVLDQWHWRNPLPQGNALQNLIHADGQYIALSELGSVLTSTNGITWIRRETGLIDSLGDCAFGDGQFVAVGPFGAIATSSNGATWVPQFGGTFYSLHGVAYGNGKFVAVGDEAAILTSEDGIQWITRAVGPWSLADVTYAQGVFVAVGRDVIFTSGDGIRWIRRSAPDARLLRSVSYGDGQFFAVGGDSFDGEGVVWFSPDGISWRSHRVSVRHSLRSLSYGHGLWLAAGGGEEGYFYEGNGSIYASTDTTNWTQVASNAAVVTGIAFADPCFVAASDDGRFLMSSNGMNWFDPWQSSLPPTGTRAIAFVNNSFAAVGGKHIALSADGYTWTNNISLTNTETGFNLQSIAYGHGRYVAGGEYRTIWTSVDGINWSNPAPQLAIVPYVRDVGSIAFGNGRFVGVTGYQGDVLTSDDGLSWTAHRLETNDTGSLYFRGVAFGNGVFAAVGSYNKAAVTADGTNWMLSPLTGYFTGIAYGNGVFVAVGDDVIATSSNGVHWTTQAINESGPLNGVAFGSDWFVAVGGEFDEFGRTESESPILISQDGVNWIRRRSFTTQELSQVAHGHHTFVIATGPGGILQSDPLVGLTLEHQATPRLLLSGPLNRSFRIEYADTLVPPVSWQLLSNIVTTTDPFLSFDSQKPGHEGARYYRAVLLP